MADAIFEEPRLAAIYDALEPDRSDLEVYAAIVAELSATSVVDVGCGTGCLAVLLAERGIDVVGVDPARASLDVARAKPFADRVWWLHGDAGRLPPLQADLAVMTGNVAQAIADPEAWDRTLRGLQGALRPGGHLVFETRIPAAEAWRGWTRDVTYAVTEIDGVGTVETWTEVRQGDGPLVTFDGTVVFRADGAVLRSRSTLRFRERDEVEADLARHGYVLDEVRDAPDRPAREYVFLAHKQEAG